ncbi:hypothetical protein C2W62_52590 [Candidatus Entotheonella serta]|nr:hypothetical protein C2W62_52590 [Candidatus Entotheonella serta]
MEGGEGGKEEGRLAESHVGGCCDDVSRRCCVPCKLGVGNGLSICSDVKDMSTSIYLSIAAMFFDRAFNIVIMSNDKQLPQTNSFPRSAQRRICHQFGQ